MDHKILMASLGGPHAVHAALLERGIDIMPVSVRAWALTERNIPAKYWLHILSIAADRGVDVSMEDMAQSVSKEATLPASPSPESRAA
jgi:hypothetical protein